MKKFLYSVVALAIIGGVAWAQSVGWPPPAGMLAALGVYNSSAPTLTNGQVSPVQLDSSGNLKVNIPVGSTVSVIDGVGTDATGTFTNATQTTSVSAGTIDGYGTITVSINGTYGTASGVFEQSDDGGTTYYPVLCSQEGASILDLGYTQLTSTNRMWRCSVSGADTFRVRSTAVASGTVNVLISISAMPTANGSTVGVAPTIDQTGGGTLTIVDSGSSTTTGQSGSSIVTGTATVGSTVTLAINGRGTISTQLSGTWVGTLSLEASIDGGTTWEPYSAHVKGAALAISAPTGNGIFNANVSGATNYRVRWTARTSGSVTVTFVVSVEPSVVYINNAIKLLDAAGVNQATIKAASTAPVTTDTSIVVAASPNSPHLSPVAPATATATKSILLGVQATTVAVNPTNGQQGALSSDTNNNLLVSSGGAPNLLTAQVSVATSDTAVVAARALRRSVTITNVTGTQDLYCSNTTATTANGQIIPGVKGASWNISTTAAIRCIAVTGAQTVSIAEIY